MSWFHMRKRIDRLGSEVSRVTIGNVHAHFAKGCPYPRDISVESVHIESEITLGVRYLPISPFVHTIFA